MLSPSFHEDGEHWDLELVRTVETLRKLSGSSMKRCEILTKIYTKQIQQ